MSDFLVDHARINAWCNPTQDTQLIFAGKRVSRKSGVINRLNLFNRDIHLPSLGKRYHVFFIGQIAPSILGLKEDDPSWISESWIKLSDTMNVLQLYCNVYTDSGFNLPKYNAYYMYTEEQGLLYAVEECLTTITYSEEQIYLRLYTNAFFQSVRASSSDDIIYYEGKKILNMDELLEMQTKYNIYNNKQGHVFCYKNGYLIDKIDAVNILIGDIAEFIFDGSVKRKQTFIVNDLLSFNSVLDNEYKYLLNHIGSEKDTIDYHDDIEINVYHTTSLNRFKGLYYHRNTIDSHRMITHKDYSIPVDRFEYLATKLSNSLSDIPLDFRQLKIEVVVRESGYNRPLIFDNNRVFELFKLSDTLRLQAMVGLNATCNNWKAEVLENSDYTKLMRSDYTDINLDLVKQAYGYNSITKYIADNPIRTELLSGFQTATLPYALRNNSTIYEYDENGYLIDIGVNGSDVEYRANNPLTRSIEGIRGIGSYSPNVIFGTNNLSLPAIKDYRVYMCRIVNGLQDNIWSDITGSDHYHVTNNVLIWNNNISNHFLMVRFSDSFLNYEIDLLPINGLLYFTLSEQENRGSGLLNYVLPVPLGELDIYLNGKILIRNLDYIFKFPKVYIINKNYLNQPANSTLQKIQIRYTGFANSDLTNDSIDDFGFIEHGKLSNNNIFDVRDDKVLQIAIDGKLVFRDDIQFSELIAGSSSIHPLNGKPYQIKDIIVPVKDYLNEDTYTYRNSSIVIDNEVANYLTLKLPQPVRSNINIIAEKYPVISPFICFIIYALINNQISSADLTLNMSDNAVINICQSREYLLEFDPISEVNKLNANYVYVQPHNLNNVLELTSLQYSFLSKVIRLYGNNVLTLSQISPFITVVN